MNCVWISQCALAQLTDEANRTYPLETGGVLVGYRSEDHSVVVSDVLGPGPEARHRRHRFEPDHNWQCAQLDRIFQETEGQSVYLGDWHTHPDGVPEMSWLDRRTLRGIAMHTEAKVAYPVMLIGAGSLQGEWNWKCHQFHAERAFGFIVNCVDLAIRPFSAQIFATRA